MQVPVLETPEGPVFESNAIARYGIFPRNPDFNSCFLGRIECIGKVDVMQLLVVDGLLVFEIVCFSVRSGKDEGRRFVWIISL